MVVSFVAGVLANTMPGQWRYDHTVGTFVALLPTLWFAYKKWGISSWLKIIVGLTVIMFGLEVAAHYFGVPYGEFTYTDALWPQYFGVPVLIGLVWATLIIAARGIAPWYVVPFILAGTDLLFDPIAVDMGLWLWPNGGEWFGVPYSNTVGWFLIALIGVLLYERLAGRKDVHGRWLSVSLWCNIVFFLGYLVSIKYLEYFG